MTMNSLLDQYFPVGEINGDKLIDRKQHSNISIESTETVDDSEKDDDSTSDVSTIDTNSDGNAGEEGGETEDDISTEEPEEDVVDDDESDDLSNDESEMDDTDDETSDELDESDDNPSDSETSTQDSESDLDDGPDTEPSEEEDELNEISAQQVLYNRYETLYKNIAEIISKLEIVENLDKETIDAINRLRDLQLEVHELIIRSPIRKYSKNIFYYSIAVRGFAKILDRINQEGD